MQRVGIVLRFYDSKRDISLVIEHVICALLFTTTMELAMDQDLAFREREFFTNLGVAIPTCRLDDRRRDVLGADIALSKVLFVEDILQGFPKVR